jgi:hypothetical protein
MCDVDYGERAKVWDETHPKARKAHRCDLCALLIVPGTVYDRIASLGDGWVTYRLHPECHALQKLIAFDVCGQEVYFAEGDLRENVREHMTDEEHGRKVLAAWRDLLRARRAEGVWPAEASDAG